ncbi:hypothetical protein LCGC14_2162230, partial [marine sediment metagenome]
NVGRHQVYLTEEEEIKLTNEYSYLRSQLHTYVLSKTQCVRWFFKYYDSIRAEGKSVAKLSADFNPREKGAATIIEQKMERLLIDRRRPRHTLFKLNLSEYCYSEMIKLMPPTKKLDGLLSEIWRIEDILLRSMLMAAQDIASKSASRILSIDEADAAQEVNLYFLESIRKYNPQYRTPQGKRVKLCTYAYGRAERLLQEWVLTTSRLVRVPRSKMERILIIVKAYDSMDQNKINLVTLTDKSNDILKARKGELTVSNTFDVTEVDDLIKILLSGYIHLDQPFNKHQFSRGNPLTIGEMLSDNAPSADEYIQDQDSKEQLMEVMSDHLTDLEFKIIQLRYFHDPLDKVPKALTEVSGLLVSVYDGVNYSRESIRQIEKSALSKLRNIKEVQELW